MLGLAKIRGKKTTSQFIEIIFEDRRLKYYAGILENPWTKRDVEAKHKAMITLDEYYAIKFYLQGRRKIQSKYSILNELFPLRRTVICDACNSPFTGSSSRGNGGKYAYYHCHNRQCEMYGKTIPKLQLENEFITHMGKIAPSQNYLLAFKETVTDTWREEVELHKHAGTAHKKALSHLEAKLAKIYQMAEDDLYSNEEFRERRESIKNEIVTVKISRNESKIEQLDVETTLTYAIEFVTNLGRLWFDLPPELRVRFQKLVFPRGLPYSKKNGFGTTQLGLIYEVCEDFQKRKSTLVDPALLSWNQIWLEIRGWERLRLVFPLSIHMPNLAASA